MKGGWFVGDFQPSIFKTGEFEVAIKNYGIGDHEPAHYHKVATELTVIVKGIVKMNGAIYNEGDIIKLEPGESTDFTVVSDEAITAVVKYPCVAGDKYPAI